MELCIFIIAGTVIEAITLITCPIIVARWYAKGWVCEGTLRTPEGWTRTDPFIEYVGIGLVKVAVIGGLIIPLQCWITPIPVIYFILIWNFEIWGLGFIDATIEFKRHHVD